MDKPSAERIFNISGEKEFSELALEVFRFQAAENPVYAAYLSHLGIDSSAVADSRDIPFLPIEFFREHRVISGKLSGQSQDPSGSGDSAVFGSSATTSARSSKHYVSDLSIYRQSFTRGFKLFYGDPKDYCILALLPSYLERQNSSLVYMVKQLIDLSGHAEAGFYLDELDELVSKLEKLEQSGQKTLLIGVSFALLDMAEQQAMQLRHTIVMETGGMKGRRREMTREELHKILKDAFGVPAIHSEYGMTELLSQAWSKGKGIFHAPPWMKVLLRDPYDPLNLLTRKSSGGINLIDLANLNSCSFIATRDIGRLEPGGGFRVLGRFDNSDIRGCNLMVE
jgi:hypothetical protein